MCVLQVGTETLVDKSKSTKTCLMSLLGTTRLTHAVILDISYHFTHLRLTP